MEDAEAEEREEQSNRVAGHVHGEASVVCGLVVG
jgi:hypothetical protein